MKMNWKGSGTKIHNGIESVIMVRWLWMEPDFMFYEIWSHRDGGAWKLILELRIWS